MSADYQPAIDPPTLLGWIFLILFGLSLGTIFVAGIVLAIRNLLEFVLWMAALW